MSLQTQIVHLYICSDIYVYFLSNCKRTNKDVDVKHAHVFESRDMQKNTVGPYPNFVTKQIDFA